MGRIRPLDVAAAILIFLVGGCSGASTAASPGGDDPTTTQPATTPDDPEPTPDPLVTDEAKRTDPPATDEAERTDPPCPDEPCYHEIVHVGTLSGDVVEQVSGMSESHRNPGLFYVVSDLQGTSAVAVVEDDGTLVAHIGIDGMSTRDAEALAVGPCEPGSATTCLYIGDIGNHVGLDDLFVYRVVEPDLTDPPTSVPADQLRYTYPDSWTDAEALLVDGTGRPIIISKARYDHDAGASEPTRVYRGVRDGGQLELVTTFELPEPLDSTMVNLALAATDGRFGHVVTGADAHDGRVILRTYAEIYEYRSPDPDADVATFPDWPAFRVPTPFQLQSEAIAYRVSGCGYLTADELTGSLDAVTCD